METTPRKVSAKSLENLKLGSQSRYEGKERHNYTILPETAQWLKETGNASHSLDILVSLAKQNKLPSYDTHHRIEQPTDNTSRLQELEQAFNETYAELQGTRSQLKAERDRNQQLVEIAPQPSATDATSTYSQLEDAIALLTQAITPEKQGGSYRANNATGLKQVVTQALNLMEAQTTPTK